jgi:hypothetical protein
MKIDARIFGELAAAIAAARGQPAAAGFIVLPITAGEAATIEALDKLPAETFKTGFTSQMFSILPGDHEVPAPLEARLRQELCDMLVAEYQYWRNTTDDRILTFSLGGMGAAANVLAAVATGQDPVKYREQVARRDGEFHEGVARKGDELDRQLIDALPGKHGGPTHGRG